MRTRRWDSVAMAVMMAALVLTSATNAPAQQSSAAGQIDLRELRLVNEWMVRNNIRRAEADIAKAMPYLRQVWSEAFSSPAPPMPRFRSLAVAPASQGCQGQGAYYCIAEDTIYYNPAWLGELMTHVSAQVLNWGTKTDGDSVAALVIAHELGHAMAARKGITAKTTYLEEGGADCTSGVAAYLMHGGRPEGKDESNIMMSLMWKGGDTDGSSIIWKLTHNEDDPHGDQMDRILSFESGRTRGDVGYCMQKWIRY
jgi:predicted metalloprotease